MFYAFLLLGKKGPLAKVWLAAHWEKKLTKANVFETDVESSVERIKAPPVKISLRTSGHLLLGLSRIYLRKAKYLVQDCSEVFMKIRMAFRPGAVDLPPQTREADPQVITLPDLFKNFEDAVAEINVNLETEFTIPEARIKAITMPDDSHDMGRPGDEMDMGGFGQYDGELDFNSLELLRDPNHPEESTFDQSKDNPSIEPSESKAPWSDSLDHLIAEKVPTRDSTSFAMDGELPLEQGEDIISDELAISMPHTDNEQETSHQDQPEDMETSNMTDDAIHRPRKRDAAGSVMSDFTLTSIDISTVYKRPHPPGDDMPVNKKRRSVAAAINRSTADGEVKLNTAEIRKWFEDQTDIETDIISAPANSMSLLPRLSAEQKLFELPTFDGGDDSLRRLFTLNCTEAEKKKEDDEQDLDESATMEQMRDVALAHEPSPMPTVDTITLEPMAQAHDSTVNSQRMDATNNSRTRDSIAGFADGMIDGLDMTNAGASLQDIDFPTLEEEPVLNGEEDTGPNEDERPDEYEDRKWNKKTQTVLNQVGAALGKKNKPIIFHKVLNSTSRKQAATDFFSLLLLTTRGSLTLKQEKPYGDIWVSKGPKFASS